MSRALLAPAPLRLLRQGRIEEVLAVAGQVGRGQD
jgi:hypothetical protein